MKLNICKAYDYLTSNFLFEIIQAFPQGVDIMDSLISSPFYYIMVNGYPSKPFNPSQGIHKRGP